jgi:hypothetical protein
MAMRAITVLNTILYHHTYCNELSLDLLFLISSILSSPTKLDYLMLALTHSRGHTLFSK